jgi:hypothetical protein
LQLLSRKFIAWVYSDKFEGIFEARSSFWHYDSCGEEVAERLRAKATASLRVIKLFRWVGLGAVSVICLAPLLVQDGSLPNDCWVPSGNKCIYVFVYLMEVVFFIELALMSVAIDGFFLFLCTDVEAQLVLITETLKSVRIAADNSKQDECFEALKTCSVHHGFLLK